MPDHPTQVDQYLVDIELGQGAMKIVWRAWDRDRPEVYVALAMMKQRFPDEQEAARFNRELDALLKLRHPNIVQVKSSGVYQQQPYFVMEYLEGGSLSEWIDESPLTGCQAASLLTQMCDGIAYANSVGILHRDIKPENMLFDGEHTLKITDFGLAKNVHIADQLTTSGQGLGTRWYVSPEQLVGDLDRVGPASEVFSLGVSLIEMLVGRRRFFNLMRKKRTRPFEEGIQLFEHEPDLQAICRRCTAELPTDRFPDVEALGHELRNYLLQAPRLPQAPVPVQDPGSSLAMAELAVSSQSQLNSSSSVMRRAQSGQVLQKRYRLMSLLGVGAMGEVWKAADSYVEDRCVVIKMLPLELRHKSEAIEELRRNFQIVADVHHSNVCPVRDVGFDQAVGCFLVMMYIEGHTLQQEIQRRKVAGLSFEPLEIVKLLAPIADALDKIHRETGITHRDIKPANMMLSPNGQLWLIDFGLAKQIQNTITQHRVDDGPSGTPHYIPPEAWRCEQITGCSDQFSLGVVVYQLLSGETPFENCPSLREAVCHTSPVSLAVSGSVNKVLQRVLSKQPSDRFNSCGEFVEALRVAVASDVETTQPDVKSKLNFYLDSSFVRPSLTYLATGLAIVACFMLMNNQPRQTLSQTPASSPNSNGLETKKENPALNQQPKEIARRLDSQKHSETIPSETASSTNTETSSATSTETPSTETDLALLKAAESELENQNYPRAIELLSQAILQNPKLIEGYVQRGIAQMYCRDYQSAINDFDKALSIDAVHQTAMFHRCTALQKNGDHTTAIEGYSRLLEIKPKHAEALFGRGIAWCKLGSTSQAISDFTDAIAIQQDFPDAFEERGHAFVDSQQFAQAINDYSQAMKLDQTRSYLEEQISECTQVLKKLSQ